MQEREATIISSIIISSMARIPVKAVRARICNPGKNETIVLVNGM
jgi:hypothetical protein